MLKNPLKFVWNYYFEPEPTDKWGRPMYVHGPIIHRFTLAYVFLALAIIVGLYKQHNDAVVAKQLATKVAIIGNQNRTATCRVRRNFEVSYAQTKDFLDKGGHLVGVSDALLRRGMANNQKNSEALRSVKCRYKPIVGFEIRGRHQ